MKQNDRRLGASIGRLLAPTAWITGALVAALTWFAWTPVLGVATLGVSVVVTLLLARMAIGWRAVPMVFTLLSLASPVVLLLGSAQLHRWVGSHGSLGMNSDFFGEWRSFLSTTIASGILASPCAFLLGVGDAGFGRLRSVALRAAPLLVLGSLAISTCALVQVIRRPAAEAYARSLPLVVVIPPSADQPCTRLPESGAVRVKGVVHPKLMKTPVWQSEGLSPRDEWG